MAEERIQKIMAEQGLCSRRAAEQIIAEGRVKVNGHPVKVGDKMDPNRDVLHVDDERIYIQKNQQLYYLALYKPRGYVTTASDELGRKTVMELVSDIPARLYPVGRLDKDSEGLLLMTDDGAFINMLTHPSGGVGKLYRVTVNPRATEQQIIEMSSGVVLDDGVKTKPCVIHVVVDEPGRSVLEITLHEGRNRQIRRMCSAVGLQVVRLRRSAEGPVKLGMLQPGEYRELKKSEINALRNADNMLGSPGHLAFLLDELGSRGLADRAELGNRTLSDITTNGANVFLHKNLPPFDLLKMIQDGNHPPVASMLGSRAAGYRKSHGRGLCVLPFPWLYYSE